MGFLSKQRCNYRIAYKKPNGDTYLHVSIAKRQAGAKLPPAFMFDKMIDKSRDKTCDKLLDKFNDKINEIFVKNLM